MGLPLRQKMIASDYQGQYFQNLFPLDQLQLYEIPKEHQYDVTMQTNMPDHQTISYSAEDWSREGLYNDGTLPNPDQSLATVAHGHVTGNVNLLQSPPTAPSPGTEETTPLRPVKLEPPPTPSSPEGCSKHVRSQLRKSIVSSRKARGENEIHDLFPEKKPEQLNSAEKAKRERRREQNRRAARKCRGKKREKQELARQEVQKALEENKALENKVLYLKKKVNRLQSQLSQHVNSGCCLLQHDAKRSLFMNKLNSDLTTKAFDDLVGQIQEDIDPGELVAPQGSVITRKRKRVRDRSATFTSDISPVPSPAKRNPPSENQVVPSVSPKLISVELSPVTPQTFSMVYDSYNENPIRSKPSVPGRSDRNILLTADTSPTPFASANSSTSFGVQTKLDVEHYKNQTLQFSAQENIPSNNLPSWDLLNLQPMNIPGMSTVSSSTNALNTVTSANTLPELQFSCDPRSVVDPANQISVAGCNPNDELENFGGLSFNANLSERQLPVQSEANFHATPDPSLESLAQSCVSPNLVQPHITRYNNCSDTNRIKNIYHYLLASTPDMNTCINVDSNNNTTVTVPLTTATRTA